jgi:hypothetical protein
MSESLTEKKQRRAIEGEQAWTEYVARQKATDENMLRLRALRLARDAQVAETPAKSRKGKP